MISPYFSDADLINSLRKYYNKNEQYNINFRYWLHTARKVKDGIMVQIGSRKFLIDELSGTVVREIKKK